MFQRSIIIMYQIVFYRFIICKKKKRKILFLKDKMLIAVKAYVDLSRIDSLRDTTFIYSWKV